MFNPDFYPTPLGVVEYMISQIDVNGKVILEPSAGSGNIVDALFKHGSKQVLTYEIEPDLQKIVATKSKLLGSDFLESKPEQLSHINAIIANPPFSTGGKHILKMWEVAPEGCEIISLCNSNTLEVDYTRERRELNALISNHGTSENLGDCFATAERKTGVSVTMVKLFKPVSSKEFEWEGFFMDEEDEVLTGPGIMQYNEVRSIVNRYTAAVDTFDEYLTTSERMNALLKPIGIKDNFSCSVSHGKTVTTKEEFSKELQKSSWDWIFKKMNIEKFITSGVLKDINKFVEQQQKYPFSMRNIYRMFEIIVGTRKQTMDRAIVEIFDKITKHYDDNRYQVEGWKTNSHYIVNKKFIFPYMCKKGWHGEIDTSYDSENKMDDINKVLCYLTGQDYSGMLSFYQRIRLKDCYLSLDGKKVTDKQVAEIKGEGSKYTYDSPFNFANEEAAKEFHQTYFSHKKEVIYSCPEWGQWADWDFFEFKCYKKGTVHFKFKDLDVWAVFNRRVAEIKGFPLPEKL